MIHLNITAGLMTERFGRKQPAAEYQTKRQHSLVYLHGARYIYTQMSIPGCHNSAFNIPRYRGRRVRHRDADTQLSDNDRPRVVAGGDYNQVQV